MASSRADQQDTLGVHSSIYHAALSDSKPAPNLNKTFHRSLLACCPSNYTPGQHKRIQTPPRCHPHSTHQPGHDFFWRLEREALCQLVKQGLQPRVLLQAPLVLNLALALWVQAQRELRDKERGEVQAGGWGRGRGRAQGQGCDRGEEQRRRQG